MAIVPVPAEELKRVSDLLHVLISYALYEHSIKGLFRTKHATHNQPCLSNVKIRPLWPISS